MLQVAHEGDYEICFNNKYSMYEEKKIMFEVSYLGDLIKKNHFFSSYFQPMQSPTLYNVIQTWSGWWNDRFPRISQYLLKGYFRLGKGR